ncbi:MAG TPA: Na-translocating system protein MpsC family protein [Acidimicrobiales bacterium]|jgi:uncharacterized protein YbcI|nr:Na-translocating system protein MpsC family protein [Acidimicrobiales bacterium]
MAKAITGEMLAAISTEIARLKAHHYGKGPLESKSYMNDDFLFCVMKGGLTRVEETLVAAGDEDLVRRVRLRFQEQMDIAFRDAIEKITGRTVIGYQSQLMLKPDYAIEMFLLGEENDLAETDLG